MKMVKNMRYLLLATLIFLTGCTTAPPKQINDVCEIFDEYYDWYSAAKAVDEKYHAPIGVTMAFIHQESKFVEDARPPREWFLWIIPGSRPSSAYGYTQALNNTWREYQKSTGSWSADRDDFEDAVDFIGWYNTKTSKRTGVAKHDAYKLYLAYHEGAGGYLRGTYKKKAWLMRVAKKVQSRANMYNRQLKACQKQLDRGWPWRGLFGQQDKISLETLVKKEGFAARESAFALINKTSEVNLISKKVQAKNSISLINPYTFSHHSIE